MGAMCSRESVNRCFTPSAFSIRTRSCAPVAVAMLPLLRLERAYRNRAGAPAGGPLDARFVRGEGGTAVEDRAGAAGRDESELEMGQLGAGRQRHVRVGRRSISLHGDSDD